MSDLLIDLIELVVEIIADAATSSSSSYSRRRKSGLFEEPSNQSRWNNTLSPNRYGFQNTNSKAISNDEIFDTKTVETEQKEVQKKIVEKVSPKATQVKLEILLLSYMFKEDDGKISRKERRAIKKHFTDFKGKLTATDISDIRDLYTIDKSLINIRAFISQNNVSETDIMNSIRTLKDVERGSRRYSSVIDRIETSLLESMGY